MLIDGIAVSVRNPAGRERLVFLNPGACSTAVWRALVPSFAGTYEVVTLDYPGFGDSVPRTLGSIDELTDIVADALQTLPPKPTHLIGCSIGSWIAQRIATFMAPHDFGATPIVAF